LLAAAGRATGQHLGECRSRWASGGDGGDAGDAGDAAEIAHLQQCLPSSVVLLLP
jgi:hypothetical protein